MAARDITANRVRELFAYEPGTGVLTHRIDKPNGSRAGQRAGHVSKAHRRRIVKVDGTNVAEARVVWLLVTGEWPKNLVDHVNGDATDNRWSNLRDVPYLYNNQNHRKARAHSLVGLLGVTKKPRCPNKPYVGSIGVGKKRIYLGNFHTAEEAHAAYVEAKRRLHPGCTL